MNIEHNVDVDADVDADAAIWLLIFIMIPFAAYCTIKSLRRAAMLIMIRSLSLSCLLFDFWFTRFRKLFLQSYVRHLSRNLQLNLQ